MYIHTYPDEKYQLKLDVKWKGQMTNNIDYENKYLSDRHKN